MDEVRILIVDDEPDILEFVGYNLINEGFKVEKTNNGKDAIALNNSFKPDLIILDVMMPELDGIETCYQIKKDVSINDPKILFLTARSEDYSEISVASGVVIDSNANHEFNENYIKAKALMDLYK